MSLCQNCVAVAFELLSQHPHTLPLRRINPNSGPVLPRIPQTSFSTASLHPFLTMSSCKAIPSTKARPKRHHCALRKTSNQCNCCDHPLPCFATEHKDSSIVNSISLVIASLYHNTHPHCTLFSVLLCFISTPCAGTYPLFPCPIVPLSALHPSNVRYLNPLRSPKDPLLENTANCKSKFHKTERRTSRSRRSKQNRQQRKYVH